MTQPSQELLRRAREQRVRLDDGAFGVWSSVNGMERAFYDLAEQIVREAADEAMLGHTGYECNQRILSKFGLKE